MEFAVIGRTIDGLPLAASMENDNVSINVIDRKRAKNILRTLKSTRPTPSRRIVIAPSCLFLYIVGGGVCFLVCIRHDYSRLLAFSFLRELQLEFWAAYGSPDISKALRPYSLLAFDECIQRLLSRYLSPRTLRTPHDLADLELELKSIPFPEADIKSVLPNDTLPDSFTTVDIEINPPNGHGLNRYNDKSYSGTAVRKSVHQSLIDLPTFTLSMSIQRWFFDMVTALISMVVFTGALINFFSEPRVVSDFSVLNVTLQFLMLPMVAVQILLALRGWRWQLLLRVLLLLTLCVHVILCSMYGISLAPRRDSIWSVERVELRRWISMDTLRVIGLLCIAFRIIQPVKNEQLLLPEHYHKAA